MTSLTEFLLARIAEDEELVPTIDCPCGETPTHPLPHCGARVIAECEAKRRIVEAYVDVRTRRDIYQSDQARNNEDEEQAARRRSSAARCRGLEIAVELLAVPYADHPDYDESWRP